CLLDFVSLTVIAFRFRLPAAHALAVPCLTVAFLMGYLLALGKAQPGAEQMIAATIAADTGAALLALFAVVAVVAELFWRAGAITHARFYAVGGVVLVLVSLALVTPSGKDVPARGAIVYGVAGIGVLAINFRWRRDELTYFGLLLLIAASLWG